MDSKAIIMDRDELVFWGRVRRRGAVGYMLHKGLLFMAFYPALGHWAAGWAFDAGVFLEAWMIGVVCGGIVWTRRELRYRFTMIQVRRVIREANDE